MDNTNITMRQEHINGPKIMETQRGGMDDNEWGYDDGKEYAYKNTSPQHTTGHDDTAEYSSFRNDSIKTRPSPFLTHCVTSKNSNGAYRSL